MLLLKPSKKNKNKSQKYNYKQKYNYIHYKEIVKNYYTSLNKQKYIENNEVIWNIYEKQFGLLKLNEL